MLIISRKKNESIVINNDVTITVVEIRGDKIRLGVISPREVPVHRQEFWDAIHHNSSTPPRPISPEEAAWHQAIQAKPDDVALRLVYADWLEERGDPLGEYIRIQAQLPQLEERKRALWAEHGMAWEQSLPRDLLR